MSAVCVPYAGTCGLNTVIIVSTYIYRYGWADLGRSIVDHIEFTYTIICVYIYIHVYRYTCVYRYIERTYLTRLSRGVSLYYVLRQSVVKVESLRPPAVEIVFRAERITGQRRRAVKAMMKVMTLLLLLLLFVVMGAFVVRRASLWRS